MEFSKTHGGNHLLTFKSNINRDDSYRNVSLGDHESTMELFIDVGDTNEGRGLIEWDLPSLDITEHIGVNWDDGELVGYDGVFELPAQAIALLEHYGVKVEEDYR